MKKRNVQQSQVVIPTVAGPSEFTFQLILAGKWDWNRDLAGPVNDPWNGQRWPHGFDKKTLHAAFQSLLADRVFAGCDGMFDSVQLVKPSFTTEMNAAFESGKQAMSSKDREAAEQELKAAEQRAATLRARLGK